MKVTDWLMGIAVGALGASFVWGATTAYTRMEAKALAAENLWLCRELAQRDGWPPNRCEWIMAQPVVSSDPPLRAWPQEGPE